jgi:tripartite-type tricarboxylate transporter receptor subunit TctC
MGMPTQRNIFETIRNRTSPFAVISVLVLRCGVSAPIRRIMAAGSADPVRSHSSSLPARVTSATRVSVLPDVPTIGEFVPGYEASGWNGIGAAANTPPEVIAILNKEVTVTLADPIFKSRLLDLCVEPFASPPAEFGKFVAEFTGKWAKVNRAAGIKAP